MGQYLTPLKLEPIKEWINGRRAYIVAAPFRYQTTHGDVIEVPKGFETDLASVPRFLWRIFNPVDYAEPSVIHDWLYTKAGKSSKIEADARFHEALAAFGVEAWRRWACYLAVRFFGRKAFQAR